MNFEFVKGLRGLGNLYERCSNAEKLAVSMPDESMFAARKTAELLAKFIYMTAHKQRMERMNFLDILSDEAVQDFINSRDVMNAFHFIRRKGNVAVHGEEQQTSESAIKVLEDLHFVVGETAVSLDLISDYPEFESDLPVYQDAKMIEDDDPEEVALNMFLSYVEAFHDEKERANYYDPSDEEFTEQIIEGKVWLHERLTFFNKPKHAAIVEYLESYFLELHQLSVERAPELAGELELSDPVMLHASITIDENKTYTTEDLMSFLNAIKNELPNSNSAVIDNRCDGTLREIYYFDEEGDASIGGKFRKDKVWDGSGMLDRLESFKRKEQFSYSKVQYFPDSGCVTCAAIEKGKTKDVDELLNEDILEYPELDLYSDGFMIFVTGKDRGIELLDYPELFEQLKTIIRNNVYEYNLHFCEEAWDPEDIEYIEGYLMPNVPIQATKVKDIMMFLNKLNACLAPWKDELEYDATEAEYEDPVFGNSINILYNIDELAFAILEDRNGELHLRGKKF